MLSFTLERETNENVANTTFKKENLEGREKAIFNKAIYFVMKIYTTTTMTSVMSIMSSSLI